MRPMPRCCRLPMVGHDENWSLLDLQEAFGDDSPRIQASAPPTSYHSGPILEADA